MKANLTARQREVVDFIKGHILATGIAPSYDEIAAHIGVKSRSSVHRYMKRLGAAGVLKRDRGSTRSIEIVDAHEEGDLILMRIVALLAGTAYRSHPAVREASRYLEAKRRRLSAALF